MARFAAFRVVLQQPAVGVTTIDYHTVPGTAIEGEDYTPVTGTLSFDPGETEKEVQVELRTAEEVDEESFTLVLTNPQGLVLGRTTGTATIPAGATPPTELEGIFTNRVLGVLFYQGEKHPGEGGELSDSEWVLTPAQALNTTDDSPYPGVFGQFYYNLGPFTLKAGDGNIPTLSGFYMYYLNQDAGEGNAAVQVGFTNREILTPDNTLDPATQDAFNTWWDALPFPMEFALENEAGDVVAIVPIGTNSTTDPNTPSDPTAPRGGANFSVVWTLAGNEVTKIVLRSVPPA